MAKTWTTVWGITEEFYRLRNRDSRCYCLAKRTLLKNNYDTKKSKQKIGYHQNKAHDKITLSSTENIGIFTIK